MDNLENKTKKFSTLSLRYLFIQHTYFIYRELNRGFHIQPLSFQEYTAFSPSNISSGLGLSIWQNCKSFDPLWQFYSRYDNLIFFLSQIPWFTQLFSLWVVLGTLINQALRYLSKAQKDYHIEYQFFLPFYLFFKLNY